MIVPKGAKEPETIGATKRMKRKVVQLAVALASDQDNVEHEVLYALDSNGGIWSWYPGSEKYTSGWEERDAPWDDVSMLRKKP